MQHCEEALRVLRAEILERRNKKYLLNEQEVSRRWTFEENVCLFKIKFPYSFSIDYNISINLKDSCISDKATIFPCKTIGASSVT